MEFRKALPSDAESIMGIIAQAQSFLQSSGVDQWQNGYPNTSIINEDISDNVGYVLEGEAGEIEAYFVLTTKREPEYEQIFEGSWLNPDQTYMTLHRSAVCEKCRGKNIGKHIFDFATEKAREDKSCVTLRVDTHKDNKPMHRLLEYSGFRKCGIIYLADGAAREAFEKAV